MQYDLHMLSEHTCLGGCSKSYLTGGVIYLEPTQKGLFQTVLFRGICAEWKTRLSF